MNFNPYHPYLSRRSPILAKNVVATSHPLAAQAGLTMLSLGGNAVDAALAAAITFSVVDPTGNGLGSDAFCILSPSNSGTVSELSLGIELEYDIVSVQQYYLAQKSLPIHRRKFISSSVARLITLKE